MVSHRAHLFTLFRGWDASFSCSDSFLGVGGWVGGGTVEGEGRLEGGRER